MFVNKTGSACAVLCEEAIVDLEMTALRVSLVVNKEDLLIGIVTDGDIRRSFIMGYGLGSPVSEIMNAKPVTVDDFDAVVSLGKVGEHPSIVKRLTQGTVFPYVDEMQVVTRRQDLGDAYFPYLVVYVSKTKSILEGPSFYPIKCGAIVIEPYQCFEIDDEIDFVCVEAIMRKFWNCK